MSTEVIHKVSLVGISKGASLEGAYMGAVIKLDNMISHVISTDTPRNSKGVSITRDEWTHKEFREEEGGCTAHFKVEMSCSVVFYGK